MAQAIGLTNSHSSFYHQHFLLEFYLFYIGEYTVTVFRLSSGASAVLEEEASFLPPAFQNKDGRHTCAYSCAHAFQNTWTKPK